jgi:hypothetical protein
VGTAWSSAIGEASPYSSGIGVECGRRPDDLDPQAADCRGARFGIGARRRVRPRERRHPELREQPLEAAGDCHRQEAGAWEVTT